MCQQIIQACSGSTKPLLFAGSFLLILAAISLGYTGYEANVLYENIDSQYAQLASFYLKVAAAVYLAVVTVLAVFAAYYDQKHSIRALTLITSVNFVVAVVALFLAPSCADVTKLFGDKLLTLQSSYDFTDKPAIINQTAPIDAGNSSNANATTKPPVKQDKLSSTKTWDFIQERGGCCGLRNYTAEWKDKLPKSCCSSPQQSGADFICQAVDLKHNRPCEEIIASTSLYFSIVVAFIALVNLYLATVTGISTYRTFHYNEASQNAYT